LQGRTTAQELLSRVLNAVDVQEADYFGLTSPDDTPMVWSSSWGSGHASQQGHLQSCKCRERAI